MTNPPIKRNIIVDLDGTLALDDHRRHLITSAGWEAYFYKCFDDEVNHAVVALVQALYHCNYYIHIFTGRSVIVVGETQEWLRNHKVPHHKLLMRKLEDCDHSSKDHTGFRCDTEVKMEMLTSSGLSVDNVLFILDDRDDMTAFWRSQGFDCFQVREQGIMVLPGKDSG